MVWQEIWMKNTTEKVWFLDCMVPGKQAVQNWDPGIEIKGSELPADASENNPVEGLTNLITLIGRRACTIRPVFPGTRGTEASLAS
jgi:hypothetical protein